MSLFVCVCPFVYMSLCFCVCVYVMGRFLVVCVCISMSLCVCVSIHIIVTLSCKVEMQPITSLFWLLLAVEISRVHAAWRKVTPTVRILDFLCMPDFLSTFV